MTPDPPPEYACGYSAEELERLDIQGAFFREISERFLRSAGIGAGMRVLDLGCGTGDLTLLAGELVGPGGAVLGVDRSADAVRAAVARARAQGAAHVAFVTGDAAGVSVERPVDALVGRFFLMHQPDPAEALRRAVTRVRPGGVVAFLESHLDGSVPGLHSQPHSPLYHRVVSGFAQLLRAVGAHADMGLRLHGAFRDAGLPDPRLTLEARVEGGADSPIFRYMAESVRSMMPLARQHGVADLTDLDPDGLEEALRREVLAGGGVITSPLLVGAWRRVG